MTVECHRKSDGVQKGENRPFKILSQGVESWERTGDKDQPIIINLQCLDKNKSEKMTVANKGKDIHVEINCDNSGLINPTIEYK